MRNNLSNSEENYLKAIFKIYERTQKAASTNAIAEQMSTKAASVTDMLKRLSEKELINYKKYHGVTLTEKGSAIAKNLIRKHRLWEVFLTDKLQFAWDQVHELAEQLEHIKSDELINRLDNFLENPKFDPHGDPIPDSSGHIEYRKQYFLSQLNKGDEAVIVGVYEHDTAFLKYLEQLHLLLGTRIKIVDLFDYDGSLLLLVNDHHQITITSKVSKNLLVQISSDLS